jgi:hypothetical protein
MIRHFRVTFRIFMCSSQNYAENAIKEDGAAEHEA